MVITLASGVLTQTLAGGELKTINLDDVVDVETKPIPQIIYGSTTATPGTGSVMTTPPGNPPAGGISTVLQSTLTYNYRIRLHYNDNRFDDLRCGTLTGDGATWVNTLAGANIGEQAIRGAMRSHATIP